MDKLLLSALAISFSAFCASAIRPVVEEAPIKKETKQSLSRSAKVDAENADIFFEGFEDRPEGYGTTYDEWLPDGWQDVSKSGETVPTDGSRHNLTWRVLDNDNRQSAPNVANLAYEGRAFAFIMADVAYDGHYELKEQDEWLISPTVTPEAENWLYFKLFYNPAWTVYNSTTKTYDARNNQLEVYVTEDDGANWTKLWNVIDDEISGKYTEEELADILIDVSRSEFDPIYVNLKDYIGKPIKIAFRYFGSHGHPMSIDNVAIGIPMPKASYEIPNGFFKQGISKQIDYPADPKLLIPYGVEAKWVNTSEDVLAYEWTYSDATGAAATSEVEDLVTPAYERLGTYDTPVLKCFFESRESEPFHVGFAKMQAGGVLHGKDTEGNEGEFGVGYYDITDPNKAIRVTSDYISLHPEGDSYWEMILGQLDGALNILGVGCVYNGTDVAYGFDYVDVAARVHNLEDDTVLKMSVYELDGDAIPQDLLGEASLKGSDVELSDTYMNLNFKFPVPVNVPANTDILVLLTGFNREADNIVFPYVMTTSPIYGNSVMYMEAYDSNEGGGWYETFYNLNNFPLSGDGHFAGLLLSLGASYSWMDLVGDDNMIEVPAAGGEKTFTVDACHAPERWVLSEDGKSIADWASFTVQKDEATGFYAVTLAIGENVPATVREKDLMLVSPGSSLAIHVKQEAGEDGVVELDAQSAVKVTLSGGDILVEGAEGIAEVYNMAGSLVAVAQVEGKTVVPASHLADGVYLVRVNAMTFKVVK